ncbi:MAG: preprotein translocase subunit YajC [Aquificae bacterium]|nr:preprotein translocase subunit YajC [Aquificota bacterium]
MQGSGVGFLISNLIFFAIFIGLFYFLLIRPEKKRREEHRKFLENLKKGDKVVTSAGILGTIDQIEEDYVVLKCEGTTKCKILKEHIVGYQPDYEVKKLQNQPNKEDK